MGETATSFRAWLRATGLTQSQAAARLALSPSQVQDYVSGIKRGTDRPAAPPYAVRTLMRLVAEGKDVEPWPE